MEMLRMATLEKGSFPSCSYDLWTLAYIQDQLTYELSSAASFIIDKERNAIHITHKYYEQAKTVLYRIKVYNPSTPPLFIIYTSDLTPSLKIELSQLEQREPERFRMLVTEAVQTILEGINKRYYHIAGIAYRVTWRFE
jgi:hypothetical protein